MNVNLVDIQRVNHLHHYHGNDTRGAAVNAVKAR